jgi:hypothetical protein
MATETCRSVVRGDRVEIIPQGANDPPTKLRTATVTYVGHAYIRLNDASCYSVVDLKSLRGNENTRIEPLDQTKSSPA